MSSRVGSACPPRRHGVRTAMALGSSMSCQTVASYALAAPWCGTLNAAPRCSGRPWLSNITYRTILPPRNLQASTSTTSMLILYPNRSHGFRGIHRDVGDCLSANVLALIEQSTDVKSISEAKELSIVAASCDHSSQSFAPVKPDTMPHVGEDGLTPVVSVCRRPMGPYGSEGVPGSSRSSERHERRNCLNRR